MQEKEISLISKEVKGIYLSYVSGKYELYTTNGKPSNFGTMKDPQVLYDNLVITKHYDDLDNDNKVLIGSINAKLGDVGTNTATDILIKLMEDLYNLFFNVDSKELKGILSERLKGIANNEITDKFKQQIEDFEKSKYKDIEKSIKEKLGNRKKGTLELARRDLSNYLTTKYGAILRKNTGDIYLLDGDGYVLTDHDSLMLKLKKDFGDNFIHDSDLKNALGYISDRREPTANMVKFKNCLYDMDKMEIMETNEPIFTSLQIDYNLNPDANSILFKDFLESTFQRETKEATQEAIKGIKQLCGYFFTSGNKYNILPIFTGLTGAGKSTFFNIITGIFGKNKISGVSLQQMEKDSHAGSEFVDSHLNIIRDSDTSMIENNAILKNWTGNESMRINPKYKNPFDLSADEVPKVILVCNNMPVFKIYEDALIRRFVVVEFKVSFEKSKNKITDLDKLILSDKSEIEWFIYECIKEYKEMVENNENFIFKITPDETMELVNKHTHPLNHIIRELILKHDPEAYKTEKDINPKGWLPIFTNDLVEVIFKYAEKHSIDVPTDKEGRISKKKLIEVIRGEFDLEDGEIVYNRQTQKFDKHREYKTTSERYRGRNEKAYPNLIPTLTYTELINEIEKQRETENK